MHVLRVAVVICSHCKRSGYRGQNYFVSNKSIGKLHFLAHKHAWCSLHRTNQHDNSAYIVQRRESQHGTSRHHRFGQQNGQRNFDPTSTTLVDAYSPAASSSSSPAHISYFFITVSSRSAIVIDSSTHILFFHCRSIAFYGFFEYHFSYCFISSFIVFYVYYYCWCFIIASRRYQLLVHHNVVKRHQHRAYPFPADDKQALLLHSNLIFTMAKQAPFQTRSLFFFVPSDLHRHCGSTYSVLFMEVVPRLSVKRDTVREKATWGVTETICNNKRSFALPFLAMDLSSRSPTTLAAACR